MNHHPNVLIDRTKFNLVADLAHRTGPT